ncbi:MAG: HAD hydrolase-like protein [Proteobacteria bacterium]|nr:HAD hydrolase-like protein [Pseudomonadota bacterium]
MSSLILFDFDGVLVHNEDLLVKHLTPIFKTHLDPGNHYTYEEFSNLRERLFRAHGSCLRGWAVENNLSDQWVVEMQQITNVAVGKIIAPMLTPDEPLNTALQALKAQGHTLAILTNSHRDYTLPMMEALGLRTLFPDDMVFDTSILKGRSKQHHGTYQFVVNALATKPFLHHFMLEDIAPNLQQAKACGFTTLFIHEEPPAAEHAPFVDHHFPTTHPALTYLQQTLSA